MMAVSKRWRATFLVLFLSIAEGDDIYILDDSPGLGRIFDGIGGLSGGGVRSVELGILFIQGH